LESPNSTMAAIDQLLQDTNYKTESHYDLGQLAVIVVRKPETPPDDGPYVLLYLSQDSNELEILGKTMDRLVRELSDVNAPFSVDLNDPASIDTLLFIVASDLS
jgi:hypothetical protein